MTKPSNKQMYSHTNFVRFFSNLWKKYVLLYPFSVISKLIPKAKYLLFHHSPTFFRIFYSCFKVWTIERITILNFLNFKFSINF